MTSRLPQLCAALSLVMTFAYIRQLSVRTSISAYTYTQLSLPRPKLRRNYRQPIRTLVLIWRSPWGKLDQGWPSNATAGPCTFTYDRNRIQEAGAVLLHHTALYNETMPWKHYRDPDQYFVFMSQESGSNLVSGEHLNFSNFDGGFINLTMTHRRDSDVFTPYVTPIDVMRFSERGKSYVDDVIAKKAKVALWVVSNCKRIRGSRLRMDYVTKLVEAGLPVDRYGKCFNNKDELAKKSKKDLESYKFYLSFENSLHCKDYVTEKFWRNGIEMGRVPVVWGPVKSNLENLVPPGSFIHAEEFESPAELASYLLYLDRNDTAYREYFKWVEQPGEGIERIKTLYSRTKQEALCDAIMSGQRKVVESVSSFVIDDESNECVQRR